MQKESRYPTGGCRTPLPGALALLLLMAACDTTVVSVVDLSLLEVSPSSLTLLEGNEGRVAVIALDRSGATIQRPTPRWTVVDLEVAIVTEDGIVQARAPGLTKIEATMGNATAFGEIIVLAGPTVRLRPDTVVVDTYDHRVIMRTVDIDNSGNGPLEGLSAMVRGEGASSWLDVDLLGRTAPSVIQLHLDPANLEPGEYEATIEVASTTSRSGPAELRVRLRVRDAAPEEYDGGVGEGGDDGDDDDGEEDDDEEDEEDGGVAAGGGDEEKEKGDQKRKDKDRGNKGRGGGGGNGGGPTSARLTDAAELFGHFVRCGVVIELGERPPPRGARTGSGLGATCLRRGASRDHSAVLSMHHWWPDHASRMPLTSGPPFAQ